jgi:hypothetical protein
MRQTLAFSPGKVADITMAIPLLGAVSGFE